METSQHHFQMDLLVYPLRRHLAEQRVVGYVAGNNFLYYQPGPPKPRYVGPDFYVVLGRPDVGQLSYVVWEEGGRYPDVIIELTSKTTERQDRGRKFLLYRDVFQTPEYYLYHPLKGQFEGFRWTQGQYVVIPPGPDGSLDCQSLKLKLKRVDGWLRWLQPAGELLLTDEERATEAMQAAEQATGRAEEETRRAEQEARRAEQEARRAEQEARRADAAEAELARLRKMLADRGGPE